MSKLTDQELLEILQQKEQEIPTQAETNLPLFLSTFGLEEGTLKIPGKLLWRLYNHWSKEKMTENLFAREIGLLLPNREENSAGSTCYLLNADTIKITENIYNLVKDKKIRKENTHYYKKHFESFLKSCNIVKGTDWTPVSELRAMYISWIKIKYKKTPLGLKNFEGFCRLYLDVKGNPIELAVNKKVVNAPKKEAVKEIKEDACQKK